MAARKKATGRKVATGDLVMLDEDRYRVDRIRKGIASLVPADNKHDNLTDCRAAELIYVPEFKLFTIAGRMWKRTQYVPSGAVAVTDQHGNSSIQPMRPA